MAHILERDLFDLSQGRENKESQLAFERLKAAGLTEFRREVLAEFRSRKGGTLKTICSALDKDKNQVSGRITELKRLKLIEPNGMRADGCAVLIITTAGKAALAKTLQQS